MVYTIIRGNDNGATTYQGKIISNTREFVMSWALYFYLSGKSKENQKQALDKLEIVYKARN